MSMEKVATDSFLSFAAVIPAFNEAQSIDAVVRKVSQRALAIVVDDGSTDDTVALALAAGAHVVRHPINRGYDKALETGLITARELGCTYVVTLDADGQHDPTVLDRFFYELKSGADLVVGWRDVSQRWSEILFCFVGRAVWGLYDPLCGMKGYRMSILANIKKLNTYESIGTELAFRLASSGFKVHQLSIITKPRADVSRFGIGIRVNLKIMKALWIGLIQFLASKILSNNLIR